jgi:hypothetical protein
MKTDATKTQISLGRTVITANAMAILDQNSVQEALRRHATGDWGDLSPEDRQENDLSAREGFRILSAYTDTQGTKFWIITEADRSVTTVLLPEDY